MPLLAFGKKKEEKAPSPDVFPELEKLKAEIEGLAKQDNLASSGAELPPLPSPAPKSEQPSLPVPEPKPVELPTPKPEPQSVQNMINPHAYTAGSAEKPELYVKIEKYKEMLELLDKIKLKLADLESVLEKLREIKEQEASKLSEWKNELEDAKTKIDEVLNIVK